MCVSEISSKKATHVWLAAVGALTDACCPLSDDRRLLLPLPLCCVDGGLWCGQARHPEEERAPLGVDLPLSHLRALPGHVWPVP